jgi:hypothetical protein
LWCIVWHLQSAQKPAVPLCTAWDASNRISLEARLRYRLNSGLGFLCRRTGD